MYGPGGYPPWSFLSGFAIALPARETVTKTWFVLLNLGSLAVLGRWAYLLGRRYGNAEGSFLVAACMAVFAQGSTLRLGQYGIIVNALLVLVWCAERRGQKTASGIFFALAMIKPTSAAPFGWPLLWRRNYCGIAVAFAILALMSAIIGAMVHTSPLEMLKQMARQSNTWVHEGLGPPGLLIDFGVSGPLATASLAVAGVVVSGLLTWAYREAGMLTAFSIAAVTGRLWAYHRQYDDLMLIFPLVQLALVWMDMRRAIDVFHVVLFGATLWAPLRYADFTPQLQVAMVGIWLYGLVVILRSRSTGGPESLERRPDCAGHWSGKSQRLRRQWSTATVTAGPSILRTRASLDVRVLHKPPGRNEVRPDARGHGSSGPTR